MICRQIHAHVFGFTLYRLNLYIENYWVSTSVSAKNEIPCDNLPADIQISFLCFSYIFLSSPLALMSKS